MYDAPDAYEASEVGCERQEAAREVQEEEGESERGEGASTGAVSDSAGEAESENAGEGGGERASEVKERPRRRRGDVAARCSVGRVVAAVRDVVRGSAGAAGGVNWCVAAAAARCGGMG